VAAKRAEKVVGGEDGGVRRERYSTAHKRAYPGRRRDNKISGGLAVGPAGCAYGVCTCCGSRCCCQPEGYRGVMRAALAGARKVTWGENVR